MLDMSNALRPSELFALRWRSFARRPLLLDIQETYYKGKIRPYGKTKGQSHEGSDRQASGKEAGGMAATEDEVQGSIASCIYLSGAVRRAIGFEQLPQARAAQAGRGTGTAEADIPGHPAHDRDLGKTKGHVKDMQGMMRHSKASTTTDVYMQSLETEVRTTINCNPCGVDGAQGRRDLLSKTPMAPRANTRSARANVQVTMSWESSEARERYFSAGRCAGEACSWCGFGICDKDATKSRKGGASKCLK